MFSWNIFFQGLFPFPQVALVVKNSTASAGAIRDTCLIPEWGRSPGKRNGNPVQYSCLENPMDREAWQATLHGVTKSRTQLKCLSTYVHFMTQLWNIGQGLFPLCPWYKTAPENLQIIKMNRCVKTDILRHCSRKQKRLWDLLERDLQQLCSYPLIHKYPKKIISIFS